MFCVCQNKRAIKRRAERDVASRERFLALRRRLLEQPVVESEESDNVESEASDGEVSDAESDQNSGPDNNVGVASDHESASDGDANVAIVEEGDNNVEMAVANDSDSDDSAIPDEIEVALRDLTEEEKESYVIESIRKWATSGGILSMRKIDELLARLSFVYKKMPKSYKTLLSTEKQVGVQDMGDHLMWYRGIVKGLDQYLLEDYLRAKGVVKLDINMDGLPIFKSGTNPRKSKFWPILAKLVGTKNDPFIIAIHFGKDPKDVDLFLGDFILEVDELQRNGYTYKERNYPFSLRNFILDAPARSLIKCCIGHGGYGACEKCTVLGRQTMNRIQFFNIGADVQPRTDESYIRQDDRLHHTGRSPLEFIGIGMVSQFRLDGMHLVYEGCVKRFLEVLMTWDGEWKLKKAKVAEISAILKILKVTCPTDFNRVPRDLEDWEKFKAKDYRRTVLYDGIVAFKNLDRPIYEQFLLLHSAIFILANSYFLDLYADDAQRFIDEFIDHAAEVYGEHFVVYNAHSLKHLVDECRRCGKLDSFSAFIYENMLKTIKQRLKSGYMPLHQIAKRDSEMTDKIDVVMEDGDNSVELLYPHHDPDEVEAGEHFREVHVNDVKLKIGQKDSCFMTNQGDVFVLQNIVSREGNSTILTGKRFRHWDDYYKYPINSSTLGIMKVWELSDERESVPLENVFSKCWLMRDENHFVSVPLEHSFPLLH